MKKLYCASVLTLSLLLLPSCMAPTANLLATPDLPPASPSQPLLPYPASTVCRIIDGAETGALILAGNGEIADVYTLPVGDLPIIGADALRDGMMVAVNTSGIVFETFPATWHDVLSITVLEEPVSDLSGLYLQVLEDLWAVDNGLNEDITELGVDLSKLEGLTDSEKSALAYAFGMEHGIMPLIGTWEELKEGGHFADAGTGGLYQWDEGCLFSIEGTTDSFRAQKWRSPLGAYFYSDCSATEQDGVWSYTVGSEALA